MNIKIFLFIGLALFSYIAQAEQPIPITVYRSPTCGCCGKWIEHLQQNNFVVTDILTNDMQSIKKQHGITDDIASCHTAVTGGYVIEGHVPAKDIKALLQSRPDVFGIAIPRMPKNAPGMEEETHTQSPINFNQSDRNVSNIEQPHTQSPISFSESYTNTTAPSCTVKDNFRQ